MRLYLLTKEFEEEQKFISPREYQTFLKNKLNMMQSTQNKNNEPIHTNSPYQPKTVSSFKKDYDEFLKRNRNKI